MRVVLQRVLEASVLIDGVDRNFIEKGLLLLVCFEESDKLEDLNWMAQKVTNLRIFNDAADKMNLSLIDVEGEMLVVSQFTLYASTKKGNRPSFIKSAKPDIAIPLYENFIELVKQQIKTKVTTGKFGASMQVSLVNDGPVTLIIDSKLKE
jgi:D-tyrosyl-tRNA(Tyr) deacylase